MGRLLRSRPLWCSRGAWRLTMKQLAKFAVEIRTNDFVLRLTDEDGDVVEFASSAEQLDEMIGVLNDLMEELEDDEG
jgi:hypothetical protein